MVKLEAIPDEHFTSEQLGPDNEEDYYTDTGTFPLSPFPPSSTFSSTTKPPQANLLPPTTQTPRFRRTRTISLQPPRH
jgi:hypothetical protein